MAQRPDRIAASLRSELTHIIQTGMNDPRLGFLTVTGVDVSPDLHRARVYVSVLGEDDKRKEVLQILDNARGYLRRALARSLNLRRTPDLEFLEDLSARRGERIEALLRQDRADPIEPAEAVEPVDPTDD